jgi:rare lipoprotein A
MTIALAVAGVAIATGAGFMTAAVGNIGPDVDDAAIEREDRLASQVPDWRRFPDEGLPSMATLMAAKDAGKPTFEAWSDPEGLSAPPRTVDLVRIKSRGTGIASFYWTGVKTANGERFDPTQMTAAHRTLPFGTRLQVTNLRTGKSVMVRINDRGPFIEGREVDLSRSAAESLGMLDEGVTKVHMAIVNQPSK